MDASRASMHVRATRHALASTGTAAAFEGRHEQAQPALLAARMPHRSMDRAGKCFAFRCDAPIIGASLNHAELMRRIPRRPAAVEAAAGAAIVVECSHLPRTSRIAGAAWHGDAGPSCRCPGAGRSTVPLAADPRPIVASGSRVRDLSLMIEPIASLLPYAARLLHDSMAAAPAGEQGTTRHPRRASRPEAQARMSLLFIESVSCRWSPRSWHAGNARVHAAGSVGSRCVNRFVRCDRRSAPCS